MRVTWRSYQHPDDWPALLDLLAASHAANLADSEFRATELRGMLTRAGFDAETHTRLIVDASGRALTFAVLWRGSILGMLVRPEAHGDVEAELIDWAASVAGDAVGVMTRDDNRIVCDMLEARGFCIRHAELRMERDLSLTIPQPDLPPGFTVRALHGPDELPEWVNLYNLAFGETDIPGPTTLERWQRVLAGEGYQPPLNLVVADEHDSLVALCFCSISPVDNRLMNLQAGRTEPIATHPRFRRRGLARAAILTGLAMLREQGMSTAFLTTDSGNLPAQSLYQSLGYTTAYSARWYFRAHRGN